MEDDVGVRDLARIILEQNGYWVMEAAGFQDALELFERENRNFHLLFSDVVLPDGNGVELSEVLLRWKPDLKLLLTSGYG